MMRTTRTALAGLLLACGLISGGAGALAAPSAHAAPATWTKPIKATNGLITANAILGYTKDHQWAYITIQVRVRQGIFRVNPNNVYLTTAANKALPYYPKTAKLKHPMRKTVLKKGQYYSGDLWFHIGNEKLSRVTLITAPGPSGVSWRIR